MGVGPTARSSRKISGGSRKYRKGVDHRKGGSARKGGGCKVVPSYDSQILEILLKIFVLYIQGTDMNFLSKNDEM